MTPGLIERLEAAGGGSRELDLDVIQALKMSLWGRRHPHNNSHQWMTEIEGRPVPVPRFTTSVDAALALAERAFPEPAKAINGNAKAGYVAFLMWRDGRRVGSQQVFPSPALALCAAILKARATQEQG